MSIRGDAYKIIENVLTNDKKITIFKIEWKYIQIHAYNDIFITIEFHIETGSTSLIA